MRLLKIRHVQAQAIGGFARWRPLLESSAQLGFNTLALSGLFPTVAQDQPLILGEPDRLAKGFDPGGGGALGRLAEMAAQAAEFDLALMLDVRADRGTGTGPDFAEGSALSRAMHGVRAGPDPRDAALGAPGTALPWNHPELVAQLTELWCRRLRTLVAAGVAGFRWLEPARIPSAATAAILASVRSGRPEVRFLAWTIGMGPTQLAALSEVRWDAVVSSFPWWDLRADWFCLEVERLARLGPVVHPLDDPLAACGSTLASAHPDALRARLKSALALGAGSFLPLEAGFDAPQAIDAHGPTPSSASGAAAEGGTDGATGRATGRATDWAAEIASAHAWFDLHSAALDGQATRLAALTGPEAEVTVVSRQQGLAEALVVLLNPRAVEGTVDVSRIAIELMRPSTLIVDDDKDGASTSAGVGPGLPTIRLAGFECRVFRTEPGAPIVGAPDLASDQGSAIGAALASPRIAIEAVEPQCDAGRFPVRRCVGEIVTVEADILCDGHALLEVAVRWRAADDSHWQQAPMRALGNDRWQGQFPLERLGRYEFAVEAWIDAYTNWVDEVQKKRAAGAPLALEAAEGLALFRRGLARAHHPEWQAERERLDALAAQGMAENWAEIVAVLTQPEVQALMQQELEPLWPARTAETYPVDAERRSAQFASWYELFPRSLGKEPGRHGTFQDVIDRLPAIRAMGFDVLYFPPIHPIGRSHRKGRNNALVAAPDDPGSPYAIGGEAGGHTAVHPELGTLDDWRALIRHAAEQGLEVALDFAIQCSPDHPWLREHPEWFQFRPDGSVRYAENPPKKYEDIVNVDFYAADPEAHGAARQSLAAQTLWIALRDVVLFWVSEGIRIFRVDNPHTKPLPFWEWMIGDVRARHPEVIFLAEAFTRPKMMARLAKIGFSQSYTYFTWRNDKQELTEYLTELTQTRVAQYLRPHFFVNTPDINPYFLQTSGRAGFLIRAALAALLSGLWGMYSGFELCEAEPLPGREEYADSEKYQLRQRDWTAPGNITAEITRLNQVRRANPALHSHLGVRFYPASNGSILFFGKATPARDNVIFAAVSLDPHGIQEAGLELPLWEFGLHDHASLVATDLFEEREFTWHGKAQHLRIDPGVRPFSVWRVRTSG